MTDCYVGGSCRCFLKTRQCHWNNYKFNPLGKTIMGHQKIMQNFKLEFSLQMPELPVMYIRPDFKAELHSFFRNSMKRPMTLHHSSVLSCISGSSTELGNCSTIRR